MLIIMGTRQYNPSAGYVSGTDPLGEFVVGNAVLNKPLQLVGRATEQTARGTQIKNYYGLNEGNITPAMWEYARRNYVKDTGINNNMTEWLNSVDERDIIAFTKWLSKHSPAIAAPLIGGTLYDDKTSSELSELIYEDYGKFQVLNEANIIRTDEEIKELFNCKGEWEVTDGVADMSF
jgi:hypothetical protein